MPGKRRWAVVAGALVLVTSACASLFGFEELEVASADAGVPDTSRPAPSAETGPPSPTTCAARHRPKVPTTGNTVEAERFTIAIERLDVGITPETGPPAVVGYDLDDYCTESPASSSCLATTTEDDFKRHVVDKGEGVDNAALALLQLLGLVYKDFAPSAIEANMRRGKFGFLIDVQGYNGEATDPSVGLAFRPTLGTLDARVPMFDGTDAWMLDKEFANQIEFFGSTLVDQNAYVVDGFLYGSFRELTLPIQRSAMGNVLRIILKDVIFSAKIARTSDGKNRILFQNGVIAGKWPVADAIAQVRNFSFDSDESIPLCSQPEFDKQFRARVCGARDIQVAFGGDAAAPCDAISVGFAFSGGQTKAATDHELRLYRPTYCPTVDCATPPDAGFLDAASISPLDAGKDGARD